MAIRDLETRQAARDLFVERALSFEAVSRHSGIPLNTLKGWGKIGAWTKQRAKFQQDSEAIRGKVAQSKVLVMDEILILYKNRDKKKKFDSQGVYAHCDALRALNTFNKGRSVGDEVDKPALFVEFLTRLVDYLGAKDPDGLKILEPRIKGFADSLKS